jgi:hypothetical protein
LFHTGTCPGMPPDSGTPTTWLREFAQHLVHVHCVCTPEVAAERFFQRERHPGHRDRDKALVGVLAGIRATACFGPLQIGQRLDVDTTRKSSVESVVRDIATAFEDLTANSRSGSGV